MRTTLTVALAVFLLLTLGRPSFALDWIDAVVRVRQDGIGLRSAGTGAVCGWDGTSGYVTTNRHVVGLKNRVVVTWRAGQWSRGMVVWRSKSADVCVIQCQLPQGAVVLPLAGPAEQPNPGEQVWMAGYGGGQLTRWQARFKGPASRRTDIAVATNLIGGDSGGPVVYNGRMIGVQWGGPIAGPFGPMKEANAVSSLHLVQVGFGCWPDSSGGGQFPRNRPQPGTIQPLDQPAPQQPQIVQPEQPPPIIQPIVTPAPPTPLPISIQPNVSTPAEVPINIQPKVGRVDPITIPVIIEPQIPAVELPVPPPPPPPPLDDEEIPDAPLTEEDFAELARRITPHLPPIEMQIIDGDETFSQKRKIGGKPFRLRVQKLRSK